MLFLSELKPFVDTEIRFSCARNYHLYTLTYLCCNLCDSLLCCCCSVSVMSNSLWPHELQYARLPCPPLSPGVCSSSCPFFAYSTLLPVFSPIFILPTWIWTWSHLAGRNDKHPNYHDHTDVPQWTRWPAEHTDHDAEMDTDRSLTCAEPHGAGQARGRERNPSLCGVIAVNGAATFLQTERTQSHHSQQLLKEQIFSIHSKENYVCETGKLCGCRFSNLVISSAPFQ